MDRVDISQLVRIGRICDNFEDFNAKHTKLTHRLMINYVGNFKNLPGNTTIELKNSMLVYINTLNRATVGGYNAYGRIQYPRPVADKMLLRGHRTLL